MLSDQQNWGSVKRYEVGLKRKKSNCKHSIVNLSASC